MKLKLLFIAVISMSFSLIISGCDGGDEDVARGNGSPHNAQIGYDLVIDPTDLPQPADHDPGTEDTIKGVGQVVYNTFEGGFYGIVVSDTAYYYPSNLPPEFQQEGLMVSFTARIREIQETYVMWGLAIEIIDISGGLPNDR